jgi:hypothetical protein
VQVTAFDLAGPAVPLDTADLPSFAVAFSPRLGSPDKPSPLYLSLRTLLI